MAAISKAEIQRIKRQEFCKGVREGERRTKRLLGKMCVVNHELLELVSLIDVKYPVAGVKVSFAMADRIIKGLRSRRSCIRLAGEVQNIVNNCNCQLAADLARCETELREMLSKS